MTYSIIKHEIPNSVNTSAGDTFTLDIQIGSVFLYIEVSSDIPYLVCFGDVELAKKENAFMYADDNFTSQYKDVIYLGKYSTTNPLKNFKIFRKVSGDEIIGN